MKYLALIAFAFAGCETVENSDGSTTTRFDAKTATTLIDTGFSTYDRYQRSSHVVSYDQFGNPVYAR